MVSPTLSQTISKGEVRTIVENGDTLVIMNLEDAKVILNDLLEYEIITKIIIKKEE